MFPLYAPPTSPDDEWQEISVAPESTEPFAHKILVKCLQLKLELKVEPIFASLALCQRKEKGMIFFIIEITTSRMHNANYKLYFRCPKISTSI